MPRGPVRELLAKVPGSFTYDETERLIIEDRDEFSDGVIEERKTFEYDDSGKLIVSELDYWADGDVEYQGPTCRSRSTDPTSGSE